jgi:hypothetical protein
MTALTEDAELAVAALARQLAADDRANGVRVGLGQTVWEAVVTQAIEKAAGQPR